jgi:MFS family permease
VVRHAIRSAIPSLLRSNPTFGRFWIGQAISQVGDQVTVLALPLTAVLALHANVAEVSFLYTASLLPNVLVSLLAGAWVDRRGHRRRTMITADLGRAALTVTIPVAWALGRLTFGQLYAVAFAGGCLQVLFEVAESSFFQAIVSRERYIDAFGLIHGSIAFSNLAGPSLGGLLVQLLKAPGALLADAASFLVSAFSLTTIHPREPAVAPAQRGQLLAGVRFVLRSPVMRNALGCTTTINFFNFIFSTLYVFYAVRVLMVQPALLGIVIATGAIGGLIAAALSARLGRLLGIGRVIVLGSFIFPASLLFVPAAGGSMPVVVAFLVLYEFGAGLGVMAFDIGLNSIFAALIPTQLRSRVSAAYKVVNYGVRPVGAFVAGLLGNIIGVRQTLLVAAIGGLLSGLWLLFSPIAQMRGLPDQEVDPTVPESQQGR